MKRLDGRSNEEFRTVEARVDVVSRADGSALFAFGNSKAIVSVYGPRQLYPQHLQNPERCLLRCYYDLASFSVPERKRPGPTRRSIEISYVMTKALEPAIKLEAFPNSVIDVYALIIDSDASTRCAALNAASLALANAGVPMRELVSAVSVGKLGNELVVDLTKEEEDFKVIKEGEEQKTTDIPIAFLSRSKKISLLQLDGKISAEELFKAIELGKKACLKISKIQERTLKKIKNIKK